MISAAVSDVCSPDRLWRNLCKNKETADAELKSKSIEINISSQRPLLRQTGQ
jgi:hypothetical protein